MRSLLRTPLCVLGAFLLVVCAACGGDAASDATIVRVWFHTGQPAEKATMQAQVERFHALQDDVRIELELLPEGSYHQQVQSAALANALPDLLEIDGPYVASYVWQQRLLPLDEHVPAELRENLLPSILAQGTYEGRLWALGTFDSGLGLWGRRSRLEQAGVRIPGSWEEAWSGAEFGEVLEKLAEHDEDGQVLDLGLQLRGEWRSFAFLPLIHSAGGEVIDSESGRALKGLAGPRAQLAMSVVQSWIESGRVDPNLDEQAFAQGRVALGWGGHWQYSRYRNRHGDDLVLLPLPDFGKGAKTGQGSWCWGIAKDSAHPEAAARFLRFLLETDQVLSMCEANGAVPATWSAVAKSELHRPDGPLHLFVRGLSRHAVPRPRTPAYPIVTSVFQEAFEHIRGGRPVDIALARAATAIDDELERLQERR